MVAGVGGTVFYPVLHRGVHRGALRHLWQPHDKEEDSQGA
jgi:hypothetical protein